MPDSYHRQYYLANKDKITQQTRKYYNSVLLKDPRRLLLRNARHRAKKSGLQCDLTLDDIIIPDLCPVLLVPMVRGTFYAPSIDKIKPELGYTKENIMVMSKLANTMKSKATQQELERFAKWVLRL